MHFERRVPVTARLTRTTRTIVGIFNLIKKKPNSEVGDFFPFLNRDYSV